MIMNSYKKRFIYLLVVLILVTLLFMGKEIQAKFDPTVFKFSMNIKQIAFNRDGTLGVIAGNEITLFDINTKKKIVLSSGGKNITAMAFSPDGRYLAIGRGAIENGIAVQDQEDLGGELWDLESGEMIFLKNSIVGNEKGSGVFVVVFSPDSKYLATSSETNREGIVAIWDIQKRKLKMTLQDEAIIPTKTKSLPNGPWMPIMVKRMRDGHPTALTYSPDGKYLMVGRDSLSIWDADTGQFIKTLPTWRRDIQGLSYSPDSRFLAVAGNVSTADDYSKGSVELWDIRTEKVAKELIWNEKHFYIDSLAYSPNGKYLLTGGKSDHELKQDGNVYCKLNVQLWDVESGQSRKYEFDHPGYQGRTSVAFSSDGKRMVASSGQYIKIWEWVNDNLP